MKSKIQNPKSKILRPLAVAFRLGVELRAAAYRRGWFKTRRLNRPVVSVGNLTAGGTGKTPLLALIAGVLLKRGWKPVILTRGYGRLRRSLGRHMIAIEPSPGRVPDPREVGDEPALLARALPEVPIIVFADRYRAGRLAEDRFDVDVHLLDDGFQHWALARDLDVVVLDGTQEISDRALLPAGRMREPCSALQRAHLVVLSRVELGNPETVENCVRSVNPQAGVFHSATRLCGLAQVASSAMDLGKAHPPQYVLAVGRGDQGEPVFAFCGIGNPRAFFEDLRSWGFFVIDQAAFPDHHVYSAAEINHLGARARKTGAVALLTTEKDAMNLPPIGESEVPVLACVIQTEICEAKVFEEALITRLANAVRQRDRSMAH